MCVRIFYERHETRKPRRYICTRHNYSRSVVDKYNYNNWHVIVYLTSWHLKFPCPTINLAKTTRQASYNLVIRLPPVNRGSRISDDFFLCRVGTKVIKKHRLGTIGCRVFMGNIACVGGRWAQSTDDIGYTYWVILHCRGGARVR